MLKSFICILFCLVTTIRGRSQSLIQQANSTAVYHPASEDKLSWQRLNLWLSSTYIFVAKEGQADWDSCLLFASRSLGVSRFSILGEGIDDPELLVQSKWIDREDPGKAISFLRQATEKKRTELLVLLGAYYAFQPQNYSHYKDSVEYFLGKAINESHAIKQEKLGRQALCLLGKMYVQANDKKGDSVFKQLINQCEATIDKETEARAFAYRGIYTPVSPTTAQNKITDLQKAADLYHNLNNTEGEILALTDIGYLLVLAGQLQHAHDVLLKALQLEQAINYPYTHYNTDALAMVGVGQEKFAEPLSYGLQTLKAAESNRDSIGWGYFYARLSDLYRSEGGRVAESEKWAHKAIDRFLINRDPAIYQILQWVLIDMKNKGRGKGMQDFVLDISKKIPPRSFTDSYNYQYALFLCYTIPGQWDLALMHLSTADSVETKAEAFRGPLRRPVINSAYGFMYQDQGQYRKAKRYFEKYFSAPASLGRVLRNDLNVYRGLIQVDSALHNNVAELADYRIYTKFLDSNYTVSQVRQAEELQVMYQTQEKENQIISLNQQAKLEQGNLKQANLVKNLTIAGIIAILIIAVLLYRQNRVKQKSNNVITHKNEQLQHLLTEKEWLLKEIHHRVKNNLQIVMSLLNSQSAYIDNEPALTAIHDSQHRVHAMSLIHQKLYGSENVSSIDMSLYIREMVSYLAESFATGQRVRFEFAIEPLEVDVSQAVPLGLILNEAITNAIKYAFPDDRTGVVSISLSNLSPDQYLLVISDNGVGLPQQFDSKKPGSLGMSLMEGLSEDLDGKFSIENKNGTTIKVSFAHDVNVKRSKVFAPSIVSNN